MRGTAMNCCKVSRLLSAYLDSELTGAEMLAIRDHLRTCSTCQVEIQGLKVAKRLSGCEVPQPPVGMESRLIRAVQAAKNNPLASTRPRRFTANLSFAAASMLLVGLAAVFWSAAKEPISVPAQPYSREQGPKPPPTHTELAGAAPESMHNSDQEVQQEREFVDGSNPLSGPASAIAYADR